MSVRALIMAAAGVPTPKGQVAYTTAGTYSWTVPANVYSISMVAIQPGNQTNPTTVTVASVIVCQAKNGARIGDGGGDGAPGSASTPGTLLGGGGGAGQYTSNGVNAPDAPLTSYVQFGNKGEGAGLLGIGSTGTYGGGTGGYQNGDNGLFNIGGGPGGALSYKNTVSVTPGQVVSIVIPPRMVQPYGPTADNGAVRIIWGSGRTYPSTNTGDM